MTTTHHTPGPWTTEANPFDNRTSHAHIVWGANFHGVALVGFRDTDPDADAANARLIAAAPDLLDSLELALPMIDRYASGSATVIDTIRTAIAKAKGE